MQTATSLKILVLAAMLGVTAIPAQATDRMAAATVAAAAPMAPQTARWRFTRSALAKPGKFPEAVKFAKQVAGYINAKYPGVAVTVYAESFGSTGTIHWSSDWSDLGSIERFNAQLATDKKYWSLVNGTAQIFVEDSVRDTLLSAI